MAKNNSKKKVFDISNIIKELKSACKYDVDFDTERSNCTSECYNSDDYCRCTEITSATVESIDVNSILNNVKDLAYSDIQNYGLDRLLRYEVSNKEIYEADISGGYYGEELHGAMIESHALNNITNKLIEFASCKSDFDKVMYLLKNEYGYILDDILERNFKQANIKEIDSLEITYNKEHYRRLDKSIIDQYKYYKEPRCIVYQKDGKYILVDGYHRLVSAKNNGKDKISVICLDY